MAADFLASAGRDSAADQPPLSIVLHEGAALDAAIGQLDWQALAGDHPHPGRDPRWLAVVRDGLGHEPLLLEARRSHQAVGYLPLAVVRGVLFGRFLASLPYVSSAGVVTQDPAAEVALVERAVALAEVHRVRFLELRQETAIDHPALPERMTHKVFLRLGLPASVAELWDGFRPKVRNQIRKAQDAGLQVEFGSTELLDAFYGVFAHNMRDLGTPVYSRRLFASILRHLGPSAELGVVRLAGRPVAAGLIVHGPRCTEVPSASSLRAYNSTNANMLLYWHFLQRSVERGQAVFDFGRSSQGSGTDRFKRQWGAEPSPAVWLYHPRTGPIDVARPENQRFGLARRLWQRLPLWVANRLGPPIVRGIP